MVSPNTFTIVPDALGKDETGEEQNLVALLDAYVEKGGTSLERQRIEPRDAFGCTETPEQYPQLCPCFRIRATLSKLTKEQG